MGVVSAGVDLDFAKGCGRRDERQRFRSPEELWVSRPRLRAMCGLELGDRDALSGPFIVGVPRSSLGCPLTLQEICSGACCVRGVLLGKNLFAF
eukprot:9489714-Pyramimonas_sp.AAC.1